MINTIFYFADTLQDYQREKNGQGISDKTITFVKETGDIYLNGVNYGRHSIDELVNSPEIQEALGNIDIEARAGDLIAVPDYPTVTSTRSGNKTILTFNHLKGEKGDPGQPGSNGIDGHSPRIEIREVDGEYYWFIDGVNTGVKARGDKGDTPTLPEITPYDDTAIWNKINEILGELANIQPGESGLTPEQLERIRELELNVLSLSDTVDEIHGVNEEDIKDLIENSQQIIEVIRNNVNDPEYIKSEIERIIGGVVIGAEVDQNGNELSVTFADLLQKFDQLKSTVDQINVGGNDNITLETILSMINQQIEDNTSITQIKNKYAILHDDVVDWTCSGFESKTGQATSFAAMYADGLQNLQNNIATATAALKSELIYDTDGVLTGAMNSLVAKYSKKDSNNNPITTTLSGLITKAEESASEADMMASFVNELNDNSSQAHSAVKATADAAFVDNFAQYKGDVQTISSINQRATSTEAAIEGIVEYVDGTKKVTANKIWNTIANSDSVVSAMRSTFATTVDGDNIASIVKEDIAQDFDQASWNTYIAYMKNGIAGITGLQLTVDADHALMESFAAYTDDLADLKNGGDHVNALSIASKMASSTEAVNILSAKFKPTSAEIKTEVETQLNASAEGGSWTSFAQQLISDHTLLGTLQTKVGTLEGKQFVEASMIAGIKDGNGNVTAASIIAAVNGDESEVKINANKINIGGVTILSDQIRDSEGRTLPLMIAGAIAATQVTATQIETISGSTVTNALYSDGSGLIASGNVSWNTNGVLTLSQDFLGSLLDALGDGYTNNRTYQGVTEEMVVSANIDDDSSLFKRATSYYYTYYDWLPSDTLSNAYPVKGTLSDKIQWISVHDYKWIFSFDRGIFSSKHKIDNMTGKEFSLLTESEIDERCKILHRYTAQELGQMYSRNASQYKGSYAFYTPKQINMGRDSNLYEAYPNPSVGDWAITGFTFTTNYSTNKPGYIYECTTAGTWSATSTEVASVVESMTVAEYKARY